MRRFVSLAFLGLLAITSASASDKVPREVLHAHRIFVTNLLGRSAYSRAIVDPDQDKVAAVQSAIRRWGRYVVVYSAEDADIILAVRGARTPSVNQNIGLAPHGNRGDDGLATRGQGVVLDTGPAGDEVDIYDAASGVDSTVLWREVRSRGLETPALTIMQDLQHEVDKAEKKELAEQNKKNAQGKKP